MPAMEKALDIEVQIPILKADPRILAAYLLGSANEGRMRPDSDVDIALMPEPGSGFSDLERLDLGARLGLALGRDVDLGVVGPENLVYSRQAILCGSRMVAHDRGRAELREATLLGLYARYWDERKEVADRLRT